MSKPRCQSLTQAGKQCRLPAFEGSKYCKRHKGILIPELPEPKTDSKHLLCPKLDPDTELLMFGYLPLEDILSLFGNNYSVRDKIIKIYFPELPDIDQVIESGSLETLKYLIKHRQQILDTKSVRRAIKFGHLKIYKYLVGLGQVETFPKQSHLDMAVISQNVEIIKFILSLKIKGLKFAKGTLDWISGGNNLELVKILITEGHKITKYILRNSCRSENSEILKYLVSQGGEVDQKILEYASERGTLDSVKYLVSQDIKISQKILVKLSGRGFLEILKLVVDKGIVPSEKVLESATDGYQIQIIQYLLDIGVKPSVKAMNIAKYKDYHDLVELYKK